MVFLCFFNAFNWFWSSALGRSSVIIWFPLVLHGLLMVLVCFWLIFIVGPHPIFGYLMISHGFVWFSIWFCNVSNWFWIVGPRPIFGYLIISYGFPCFCYGLTMFPIDFNRQSSALTLTLFILWFLCFPMILYGFSIVLLYFQLILIVGPRPIFGYLMITYGFPLVFPWFCYVSGWF